MAGRVSSLLGLCLACASLGAQASPDSLLIAWLKDNDAEDPAFLATIDADPSSQTYGRLLTTAPASMALQDAHHIPHQLPNGGRIVANAFRDGQSFIFDVETPILPTLTSQFERVEGFSFPHSFAELENGNFLVTFQTSGENADQAGGLVELTAEGEAVRNASAASPAVTDFVRPYSLEVFADIDRVVSTSTDMWRTRATQEVQLWRLSDLGLLRTLPLPGGERRNIEQIPLEVRPVGDGASAYVVTWNCGLYHLTGLRAGNVSARLVWDFGASGCAIPVRVGNHWIQAVGESHQLVVLDISDPASPQLATVLQFPGGFQPHWIAAEPGGDRIVVTGYQAFSDRIVLVRFDAANEDISLVSGFGDLQGEVPGFSTGRTIWPHGKTGTATAHGVVFWPAGG